jgi:hypothetical protein
MPSARKLSFGRRSRRSWPARGAHLRRADSGEARGVLQGVCAKPWLCRGPSSHCELRTAGWFRSHAHNVSTPIPQAGSEIRFAGSNLLCTDLLPDIYARPRRSMTSKVGAPTSASWRTAAEQPAARRTPDKRELERGSVRARRAATPKRPARRPTRRPLDRVLSQGSGSRLSSFVPR